MILVHKLKKPLQCRKLPIPLQHNSLSNLTHLKCSYNIFTPKPINPSIQRIVHLKIRTPLTEYPPQNTFLPQKHLTHIDAPPTRGKPQRRPLELNRSALSALSSSHGQTHNRGNGVHYCGRMVHACAIRARPSNLDPQPGRRAAPGQLRFRCLCLAPPILARIQSVMSAVTINCRRARSFRYQFNDCALHNKGARIILTSLHDGEIKTLGPRFVYTPPRRKLDR